MNSATASAETLRKQIKDAEYDLKRLKAQLETVEAQDAAQKGMAGLNVGAGDLVMENKIGIEDQNGHGDEDESDSERKWPLAEEEYKRYGRQMIVPSIGIQGQLRLKAASVLIVGAGGLGCPAAAYLAGAGVGTIGIVDGDEVETSNLHRQILHSTAKVGMKKVDSAISYLNSLNPNPIYNAHPIHLTPSNSISIASSYDLILDCTDHPTSRYLISDLSILLRKPLISASALRTDGQLIVLNSPPLPAGNVSGGPCYRCVFPKPPPAESVVSCGDGGILGPVVGVMGVLQALEAIKLIFSGKLKGPEDILTPIVAGASEGQADAPPSPSPSPATMHLFSANSSPPFRSVRLRARRPKCFACSSEAGLSLESLTRGSLDYALFCGNTMPVNVLTPEERIEAREYQAIRERRGKKNEGERTENEREDAREESQHLLIDVREKVQFDICNLSGSINVPFSSFPTTVSPPSSSALPPIPSWLPPNLPPSAPIYVICRLGNDSQLVTRQLKDSALRAEGRLIQDVRGGLKAWKEQVDGGWPEY